MTLEQSSSMGVCDSLPMRDNVHNTCHRYTSRFCKRMRCGFGVKFNSWKVPTWTGAASWKLHTCLQKY